MGCDIHAGVEYKANGEWKAILFPNKYFGKYDNEPKKSARIDIDRDYCLFSILANVRNSYGFAGCDTGDQFTFISSERGLPKNITTKCKKTACTGDHSDTWVSLKEILDFDWKQTATRRGVLSAVQFEEWDRCKEFRPQPKEWCGDVAGNGIMHISEDEMRSYVNDIMRGARGAEWTANMEKLKADSEWPSKTRKYTRITWEQSYAECAKQVWTKILPYMLPLGAEHGYKNVRLVMNFDS